jgi:predicted transcriptional regulator
VAECPLASRKTPDEVPDVARPRNDHPTPAELEVLKILWRGGEFSVRDVIESLDPERRRAYTSVMSLLNVMAEKGLASRRPSGRAFVYRARADRKKTFRSMLGDLLRRAYEGSAATLVAHLLDETKPTREELAQIRRVIQAYGESEARQ